MCACMYYVCIMFLCSIGIFLHVFCVFVDVNMKLLFQLTNIIMEITVNIIRHVCDID